MWLLPALALVLGVTVSAAAQPAVPASSAVRELTREEQVAFLERARIVERRRVSKGVTGTVRVTLSDGAYTHDASVQTVNEFKAIFAGKQGTELGFQDTWRYNLAAYHLDGLLELEMIPVTVARKLDGQEASFTWWVDDVMMDEAERYKKKITAPDLRHWNHQLQTLRIFDQLIQNSDRNLGNMLIDRGWKVWMIDHTRAFRKKLELASRENLARCDRQLLARLKALDPARVREALGKWLREAEIAPMMARRDLIVEHFEKADPARLYERPPARKQ